LKHLRKLALGYVEVSRPFCFCFTQLTSLNQLSLALVSKDPVFINDEKVLWHISTLKALRQLRFLFLNLRFVFDPARLLYDLALLPALSTLQLTLMNIGDQGLNCIGTLTRLTHLSIHVEKAHNLVDHPLIQLADLTQLTYLHLELHNHPSPEGQAAGVQLLMAFQHKQMSHCKVVCRGSPV